MKTIIKGEDMGLRYDNRVVKIELWVNTDAPAKEILSKIEAAARGPRRDAVFGAVTVSKGEEGKNVWESLQAMAECMPENPLVLKPDK